MSSTMMASPQMVVPHIPPPDDRTPKTRRKMMFYDRIKVLLVLSIILGFLIAKYHAEIPIISWGEAARNQIAAKTWILTLMGVEAVRQLHYLASERSKGITGYQFRSPVEWFSEIYAAYFSDKLKPAHPAVSWLKTLETAEIE